LKNSEKEYPLEEIGALPEQATESVSSSFLTVFYAFVSHRDMLQRKHISQPPEIKSPSERTRATSCQGFLSMLELSFISGS
jgi:hypothetical protein